MAQEPPRKNHIANLAAAVACFEPSFVNEETKEQAYMPRHNGPRPPSLDQLVGLCIGAIGEIYEFIQLHDRLKEEHSHYLSEKLACSVELGQSGLVKGDYESTSILENIYTLIRRLNEALDILENICKSPDGETKTITRQFILQFRPNAFGRQDGRYISVENFVRTEQTPQTNPEPDTIPPQP